MRYINLKIIIILLSTFLVMAIIGITLYFSLSSISQKSDLIISELNFSNEKPLENETIVITIKALNKGEIGQTAIVYLYANGNVVEEEEIYVGSQKTKEIQMEHNFSKGNFVVKAEIVPKNVFIEKSRANEEIEKTIKVYPLKVDLIPSSISFSTNTPEINQTVKITAYISNSGGVNAENVSYEIYNETDFLIKAGKIDSIDSKDAIKEVSANFTFKNSGIHRIRVFVNTSLIEDNTSNNELSKSIIVYSYLPKADFLILSKDISVENAVEKYNSTIIAIIHNIGKKTDTAKIKFYADDLFIKEVEKEITKEEKIEINWIPNSSKFYKISVKIENSDEISKDNNFAEKEFYVKTMPDIIVENITIRKNIREGDRITIAISLFNVGEGDADNFLIEVKENGEKFYSEKISLKGKERETISILWFAKSEINKIEVVVNSDNLLIESKEENNVFSVDVSVEKNTDYTLYYAISIVAILLFVIIFIYLRTKKKAIFSVEEIFLIYRDGRLISHKGKVLTDDALISSMLTAIQEFVKDSFKAKGKIDEIQYGKERILIQHPPYDEYFSYVYLAVLIEGKEDLEFKKEMMNLVIKIHKKFSSALKEWNGDLSKLNKLDLMVEEFIKKYEKKKKFSIRNL